jgi:hypothetical protein
VDHIVVLTLQFRVSVGQQELYERMWKLMLLSVDSRAKGFFVRTIFADPVPLSAVELDDTLVAAIL